MNTPSTWISAVILTSWAHTWVLLILSSFFKNEPANSCKPCSTSKKCIKSSDRLCVACGGEVTLSYLPEHQPCRRPLSWVNHEPSPGAAQQEPELRDWTTGAASCKRTLACIRLRSYVVTNSEGSTWHLSIQSTTGDTETGGSYAQGHQH